MAKFAFWDDAETVDGAQLTLSIHAERLARLLDLNQQQTEILVSELRNALVPALIALDSFNSPRHHAGRGVSRILALTDAIARRVQDRG